MLVYRGLEEVSKDATELVSAELRRSAISTIRIRTLVYIDPLQQFVHSVFLNYNSISFRPREPFSRIPSPFPVPLHAPLPAHPIKTTFILCE